MYRKATPYDPALQRLLEERDGLKIQVNLLTDSVPTSPYAMVGILDRLYELERLISGHRRIR